MGPDVGNGDPDRAAPVWPCPLCRHVVPRRFLGRLRRGRLGFWLLLNDEMGDRADLELRHFLWVSASLGVSLTCIFYIVLELMTK